MNKGRRKSLQSIADQVEELKSGLEDLMEEEEEYRDNMPENLQESGRHEIADAACDSISDAIGSLEEAVDSISCAISG